MIDYFQSLLYGILAFLIVYLIIIFLCFVTWNWSILFEWFILRFAVAIGILFFIAGLFSGE